MVSHPTGSDELLILQTEKVSVTIKGRASHPSFADASDVSYEEQASSVKVWSAEGISKNFSLFVKGADPENAPISRAADRHLFLCSCMPLFYEQRPYEILIEPAPGHTAGFFHDNINIRRKITPFGRDRRMLSGVINFDSEIGFSDLDILIDGKSALRITIEVFPTKLRYQEDYRAILEDVTREVYSMVFDFLKKTYAAYQQGDTTHNTPVEFFAVIRKIYEDLLRCVDQILSRPHHELETIHEVMPAYKVKRTDAQTIRWLEKHAGEVRVQDGMVAAQRALGVRRQVSYDTRENRLTRYILEATARRLESLKKGYRSLSRAEDTVVVHELDSMIAGLKGRCRTSFLSSVPAEGSESGMSLVFSMAPGYRELYRYYLMLQRGLNITGDVFHISVKDLAVLYEYWCFIKLNRLLKDRYELVSQDVLKVQGNGLFVSLVKGDSSVVKYRDPQNGETFTLTYNPKKAEVPTVTQKPDNVLCLTKTGGCGKNGESSYQYVFDSKYKINPALPGSYYAENISSLPGPEVDDINTMHRYRDAIVSREGSGSYERSMFGAYVLFPYDREEEYKQHRFYKSIESVNIGGLPFLPSATSLVTDLLDALIGDSSDSAFERATLPEGIEERLASTDWSVRDVLVGSVRNPQELSLCMDAQWYRIPSFRVRDEALPIRFVALYQPKSGFGTDAGIRFFGEVISCRKAMDSGREWWYFQVKEWKQLSRAILPSTSAHVVRYTNRFLLEHSAETAELSLRSEAEYRLYRELKRAADSVEINEENASVGFRFESALVLFERGNILIFRDGHLCAEHAVTDFMRAPGAVFRSMKKEILGEWPFSLEKAENS